MANSTTAGSTTAVSAVAKPASRTRRCPAPPRDTAACFRSGFSSELRSAIGSAIEITLGVACRDAFGDAFE
jgi:hypothetical protein